MVHQMLLRKPFTVPTCPAASLFATPYNFGSSFFLDPAQPQLQGELEAETVKFKSTQHLPGPQLCAAGSRRPNVNGRCPKRPLRGREHQDAISGQFEPSSRETSRRPLLSAQE